MFTRIYRVVSYTGAKPGEAEALEVLAQLMGGDATSLFYKELVVKRRLASDAGAAYSGYARDSGEFDVYAVPRPGVLRAVTLSGAFLALLGLVGLGLGVIIRHTAGAIGAYVGLTFLLPLLIQRLPGDPSRYTPVGILANSVSAVTPQGNHVSVPVGFLLMVLYSAVVLGLGAVLIARRDA